MTVATVAQPNGNGFAVLFVMHVIVWFIAIVVLWKHERMWDAHERELAANAGEIGWLNYQMAALLKDLGREINPPAEDDSPEAEEQNAAVEASAQVNVEEQPGDDAKTDEFDRIPPTEPSGIPLQVHGALIEARDLSAEFPHPVESADAKARNAAWVEEQLLEIRARINAAQEAS